MFSSLSPIPFFFRLKEIEEEKSGVQCDEKKLPSKFGMEMIFRLLEEESNSKVPCVPMPSKPGDRSTYPKIVLFPGIEGFAKIFKSLASHLKHVTTVQYILDGETTSVIKIVEYLAPVSSCLSFFKQK